MKDALSRMAALCSSGEHCESDVRLKLQRAGVSAAEMERVVAALYAEGYLDTARYCRAFARDRLRFAHWGRVKIGQALRMKGLPEEDVRAALDALPEEEYRQILSDVLTQKSRTLRDEDERVRRGKLIRFATARGFTIEEIMGESS